MNEHQPKTVKSRCPAAMWLLLAAMALGTGCASSRQPRPSADVYAEPMPRTKLELTKDTGRRVLTFSVPTGRVQFECGDVDDARTVSRVVKASAGAALEKSVTARNEDIGVSDVPPQLRIELCIGAGNAVPEPAGGIRVGMKYEAVWRDPQGRVLATTSGTGWGQGRISGPTRAALAVLNTVTLFMIPAVEYDVAVRRACQRAADDVVDQLDRAAGEPAKLAAVYTTSMKEWDVNRVAAEGARLFSAGDYLRSYYTIRGVQSSNPKNQGMLAFMGANLARLGHQSQALILLNRCVALDPQSPQGKQAAKWRDAVMRHAQRPLN